ncbi:hypothetical protein [Candidatus Frankia nodulisporulans]|uniref:hypothetical protein n=1 Tax=Candidatus Frankia nodulisporulans TaxID=2060052 RepID=UPI0013D17886|nr:hypothetical protein [Candidatus Frankia nodulisporulans]
MPDTQQAPPAHPARPARGAATRAGTVVAGLALVGLAGLISACGPDGSSGSDATTTPSVSATPTLRLPSGLPSRLPTSLPTSVGASVPGIGRLGAVTGADALRGTNVPADFPVPPGAKARVGTTTGGTSTVTLTGVASDSMVTFYRGALPAAGYTITSDVGLGGVAHSISFTGHGIRGGLGSVGAGGAGALELVFSKA